MELIFVVVVGLLISGVIIAWRIKISQEIEEVEKEAPYKIEKPVINNKIPEAVIVSTTNAENVNVESVKPEVNNEVNVVETLDNVKQKENNDLVVKKTRAPRTVKPKTNEVLATDSKPKRGRTKKAQ